MDTKLSEKSKLNTQNSIKFDQTGPSGTLPENVTEEPQNKEHIDLRGVQDYQKLAASMV